MSETRDADNVRILSSRRPPTGAPRGVDWGFVSFVGLWQLFMFVVFASASEYGDFNKSGTVSPPVNGTAAEVAAFAAEQVAATAEVRAGQALYPQFQDVHVMIFIGFAFLMTFLSRYSWSSIGLNFLLAVLTIQWNALTHHFWKTIITGASFSDVKIQVSDLLTGDFAAAAVLIAFGAVLGRTSPMQLAVMAFFMNILFGLHEVLVVEEFKITDIGGSIVVHSFGAFFGAGVSFMLGTRDGAKGKPYTSRTNAVTAFIGTIFLWCFWPSFNGALGGPTDQQRVFVNSVFALAGSAVAAFLTSHIVRGGRFETEDIQNATLAGGVAIGTSANFIMHPSGALFVGLLAGALSVLGYAYVGPAMASKLGVDDTCGVMFLHGLPGVLAGLVSGVVASLADEDAYGPSLTVIFPERGNGRDATEVAGFQVAATALAVVFALVSGLLVGALIRLPFCNGPLSLYDDREVWAIEHLDRFPNDIGQPDEETGLLTEDHTYPVKRVATTAPVEDVEDEDAGAAAPGHAGGWSQSAVAPASKKDETTEVEMTTV